MRRLIAVIVALLLARGAAAQKTVSFPTEYGGVVYANGFAWITGTPEKRPGQVNSRNPQLIVNW